MNGVLSTCTAYSRLAMTTSLAKLPATRQTKTSPRAVSKQYSGAMRESAQLSTAAKGFCPVLSGSRSCLKSCRLLTPST